MINLLKDFEHPKTISIDAYKMIQHGNNIMMFFKAEDFPTIEVAITCFMSETNKHDIEVKSKGHIFLFKDVRMEDIYVSTASNIDRSYVALYLEYYFLKYVDGLELIYEIQEYQRKSAIEDCSYLANNAIIKNVNDNIEIIDMNL